MKGPGKRRESRPSHGAIGFTLECADLSASPMPPMPAGPFSVLDGHRANAYHRSMAVIFQLLEAA